jgi:hypothetical protein
MRENRIKAIEFGMNALAEQQNGQGPKWGLLLTSLLTILGGTFVAG